VPEADLAEAGVLKLDERQAYVCLRHPVAAGQLPAVDILWRNTSTGEAVIYNSTPGSSAFAA